MSDDPMSPSALAPENVLLHPPSERCSSYPIKRLFNRYSNLLSGCAERATSERDTVAGVEGR